MWNKSFWEISMHAHMYIHTKYICQILRLYIQLVRGCMFEWGIFWWILKWSEINKMKWACLISEHHSFIPTLFNLIYGISFLWNEYVEISYIDLECLSKSHFESMLDTILINKWMGLLQFVWKHFEIYKYISFAWISRVL
jgi:hypothetical protein